MILLIPIVVFLAFLVICALMMTGDPLNPTRPLMSYDQAREYARKLQKLIACRTVSEKDRYDDTEFAKLRGIMEELFPLIHRNCRRMTFGDDCWVYYLRGLDENFLASLVDGEFIHLEAFGKNSAWKCTFSSPYVRDCLLKAGTLLEYKTYMTALYPPDGAESSPYTDGGAGVVIDWEEAVQKKAAAGQQQTGKPINSRHSRRPVQPVTTRNEIDTLLMRGLTPVFISCKNGEVDTDELYKLGTVAGRFGNRYAKRHWC